MPSHLSATVAVMISDYDGASLGLAFLTTDEPWDLMNTSPDQVGLEEWSGRYGGYIATYTDPAGAMLTLTMCPDWFYCCELTGVTTVVTATVDQIGPHQVAVRPVIGPETGLYSTHAVAFTAETSEGWNFCGDDGTPFTGRLVSDLQVSATWTDTGMPLRNLRMEPTDARIPAMRPCGQRGIHGRPVPFGQRSALAAVTLRCDAVELRTTELTGQPWWRVTGYCGIPVTVAVPVHAAPDLRPGDTVRGTFRMHVGTGYWDTWDPAAPSDRWTESPDGTVHDDFPQDMPGACADDWLPRIVRSATWLCASLGTGRSLFPDDCHGWQDQLVHLAGELDAVLELRRMTGPLTDVADVLGAAAAIAQDVRALAPDWNSPDVTTPQLLGMDHPRLAGIRRPTAVEIRDDRYLDEFQRAFAAGYRDLLSGPGGTMISYGERPELIEVRGLASFDDLRMLGAVAVPDTDCAAGTDWRVDLAKLAGPGNGGGRWTPERPDVMAWYTALTGDTGVPDIPVPPSARITDPAGGSADAGTVPAAAELDASLAAQHGEAWTGLPREDRLLLATVMAETPPFGPSAGYLAVEVHDGEDAEPHGEIINSPHQLADSFYARSIPDWETVSHRYTDLMHVTPPPDPADRPEDPGYRPNLPWFRYAAPRTVDLICFHSDIIQVTVRDTDDRSDRGDDDPAPEVTFPAHLDRAADPRPLPTVGQRGNGLDLNGAVTCEGIRLTGVSVDLHVHATADAARDAERRAGRVPMPLVSPSLLQAYGTGRALDVDPYSVIWAEVLACALVVDPDTGDPWYLATVDALTPLTVAIPGTTTPGPAVGTWLTGYVRLSVAATAGAVEAPGDTAPVGAGTPAVPVTLPDRWMGDILTLADERVVDRASRLPDAVTVTTVDESTVTAIVQGTRAYDVRVDLYAPLSGSTCTCPHFAAGHFCKHLVATAAVLSGTGPEDMVGGYGESDNDDLVPLFLEHATPEILQEFARRTLSARWRRATPVATSMALDIAVAEENDELLTARLERTVDTVVTLLGEFAPPAGPINKAGATGDLVAELDDALDDADRIIRGALHHGRAAVVTAQSRRLVQALDAWMRQTAPASRHHLTRLTVRAVDTYAATCSRTPDTVDWAALVHWLVTCHRTGSTLGTGQITAAREFADVLTPDAHAALSAELDAWAQDIRERKAAVTTPEQRRQVLGESQRLRDLRMLIADATDDPNVIVDALVTAPVPELVTALLLLDATGQATEAGAMLDRILTGAALTLDGTTTTRLGVSDAVAWMDRYDRGIDAVPADGGTAVTELRTRLLLGRGNRAGAWSEVAGSAALRDPEAGALRSLVEQEFAGHAPATCVELHLIDARLLVDGESESPGPVSDAAPETMDRYRELAGHLAASARVLRTRRGAFTEQDLSRWESTRDKIIRDADRRYLLLTLLAQEGEGPLGQ